MSFAHEFGIAGDALHDKRILLVDDEQELASMVAAILHRAGFRAVETAHCASEALRIIDARATSPDTACQLFVLDIMMPGMNGFDLLARIRERPAHASTPALFLSAKDEPFDRVN
ncbi:MAG: response regulator, partial [Paraeggerthella sp.]|nr:response regulator [Paraeggerthella sp.]